MNKPFSLNHLRVILLTLSMAVFAGCSIVQSHYGESCNSHAYVQTPLSEYINKRFQPHAPVRMAIIPFSVPANLAAQSNEQIGLGIDLAQRLQTQLLEAGAVPIVELLNREDWPGKKEEFTHGNFGAIQFAREAGYDLVLVGMVQPLTSIDRLSVQSKVIEVESGITAWYGQTSVTSWRSDLNKAGADFGLSKRRPDQLFMDDSLNKLTRCIRKDILADKVVPE